MHIKISRKLTKSDEAFLKRFHSRRGMSRLEKSGCHDERHLMNFENNVRI